MARLVELVTLGTGAALPSLERFTASHLVRDWLGNVVLLDVGEGAQHRLRQAGVSPTRIDVIALTHGHGDHVNGLPGLLQTMYLSGRTSKLLIVAPEYLKAYLEGLIEVEGLREAFPIEIHAIRGPAGQLTLSTSGRDRLELRWFRTCHSIESYGFILEWVLGPRLARPVSSAEEAKRLLESGTDTVTPRPFRLAYTGDTSPCDEVVSAVTGVNVLIHEATFDRSMESEASKFGHSTSVGAATVAKRAGVQRLILTHISTRYEGYEAKALEDEAHEVFPNTILAWDLARFSMRV
ncbi:MAG: ribonuclease Z [Acidilobus sp.]